MKISRKGRNSWETLEIIPAKPAPPKRLRWPLRPGLKRRRAAPRVLAAQVSYYSRLIHETSTWEYAGVYSDEGITGTSIRKRDGFNNPMEAARAGEVNLILTKSISRFARNTVDLLAAVRELTSLGCRARFERENIDTSTADGELLLTLLASFAQAESEHKISQNTKWGITRGFQAGKPTPCQIYGYRYTNGTLEIIEEEAAVVRRLFSDYLAGITPEATVDALNQEESETAARQEVPRQEPAQTRKRAVQRPRPGAEMLPHARSRQRFDHGQQR